MSRSGDKRGGEQGIGRGTRWRWKRRRRWWRNSRILEEEVVAKKKKKKKIGEGE